MRWEDGVCGAGEKQAVNGDILFCSFLVATVEGLVGYEWSNGIAGCYCFKNLVKLILIWNVGNGVSSVFITSKPAFFNDYSKFPKVVGHNVILRSMLNMTVHDDPASSISR